VVVAWLAVKRERFLAPLRSQAGGNELAAGLIGAWFAVVIGAVSNDSGPVILLIGALMLLLGAGYAGAFPRPLRRPGEAATLRGCA
jgi:hypothetical protein